MTRTDPFWDEVHRLLPDVDLVLLPPQTEPPPATDSRFVAAIRARRTRDGAHAVLAGTWRRLLAGVPEPATVRRLWLAVEPSGRAVRVELVARHAGRPDAGARHLLAAARAEVEAAGGSVAERRWADADGLRLVTAVDGCGVDLYAVLTPPALTLTVLGPPVGVPEDLGRELAAAGPEDVPL
jgi:hypothetical protein